MLQAASRSLSDQLQKLQQQVADGLAAASQAQKERQAAADQLQQVELEACITFTIMFCHCHTAVPSSTANRAAWKSWAAINENL